MDAADDQKGRGRDQAEEADEGFEVAGLSDDEVMGKVKEPPPAALPGDPKVPWEP